MPMLPLKLPPGVSRQGTVYENGGRWFDSQLVRFFAKSIQPFGGWRKILATTVESAGRGMLTWLPGGFSRQAIIGTAMGLFLYDDDSVYNITPLGYTPGNIDTLYGLGYGSGTWGDGVYGVSSGAVALDATVWHFDTWGDWAVGVASHDGQIYVYKNIPVDLAVPIAEAPECHGLIVTSERILVAIASSGDPRQIEWSDYEDFTNWTPDSNTAAGDWRFQTDGTLVTARRVKGATLYFTTTDCWRADHIGLPLVYKFELVAAGCGLIGPLAVQTAEGGAIWMGRTGFHQYQGGQIAQIPCDLLDYVFDDINTNQSPKFAAGHLSQFGEILFFYCSAGSDENDRCVAYNYRENHWTIIDQAGLMARGCWADSGAFPFPIAVGVDGSIYQQEDGFTASGTPLLGARFVESGPLELGAGDNIIECNEMYPDERTSGQMQVTFKQQMVPEGAITTRGPYPITRPYTPVRVTARQSRVRLEATADAAFRFGTQRFRTIPGGER